MNRFQSLFAAAALAAAALSASAQDLTIVQKTTKDGEPPATTTSYLAADRVRIVQGDGNELMFDGASGDITMIDHRKKEYSVLTQQDLKAMTAAIEEQMKAVEPQMKQMQEQLQNMPPEMQKRMQGMMGGMAASVEVQKGTGARKVAGYSCEPWTISVGSLSKTEQCLTSDLVLPAQIWDRYKDLADTMMGMMRAMGPMAQGAGLDKMKEKMKPLRGYPLSSTTTVSVMGRTTTTTTEVTEVKKGAIPASAWQLPAGYKAVESPMKKAFQPTKK